MRGAATPGGATARRRPVSTVAEAIASAADGVGGTPLLVIGRCAGEDHTPAIRAGVDVSVCSIPQLVTVAAAAGRAGAVANVHLEIDTGLRPDGGAPESWSALVAVARRLSRLGRIDVRGVWSAQRDPDAVSAEERERLRRAIAQARRIGLPSAALAA